VTSMVCCLGIIRAKDTVGKEMTTMMMMKALKSVFLCIKNRN